MILEKIKEDLKEAMKAHADVRVSTLRMVISAVGNARIASGKELDDEAVQTILAKEVKLRDEAIRMSQEAGRDELVSRGEEERKILKAYLPEEMPEEEVRKLVDEAINEVQAKGRADMGKVMVALMPKVKGRADGSLVSRLVQERLS